MSKGSRRRPTLAPIDDAWARTFGDSERCKGSPRHEPDETGPSGWFGMRGQQESAYRMSPADIGYGAGVTPLAEPDTMTDTDA